MSENEAYVRQLLPKKCGYPLWCPKPPDELPPAYQAVGVTIGDVGVVTEDGVFDRIFNICSPVEVVDVPSGFEQMRSPANIRNQKDWRLADDYIASTRMEKTQLDLGISSENDPAVPFGVSIGFQLSSSSKEGAVLMLPDGASRHDARCCREFREYALRHAKSWYEFVNDTRGMEIANGALYLVTGCDKSSSWGVASFSNNSKEGQVSLKFTAVQDAGVRLSWDWKCEEFSSASVRSGPRRVSEDDSRPQNQCVFIRGFRVMLQERTFAALAGAVNVEHVGGHTSHRSSFSSPSSSLLGSIGLLPFGGGQSQSQQSQRSSEPSTCVDDPDEVVADRIRKNSPESTNLFDEVVADYDPHVEVYHPSMTINKYLLDAMPMCEVSIAHDDDWCAILEMDDADLPDPSEILRRVKEKYQVVDCGGAYLVPKGEPKFAVPRHQKYYFSDGNLYIIVDNHLFRVHRVIFERQSTHLREMLSDPANPKGPSRGTSESTAIMWDGIKATEFEDLLSLYYDQTRSLNDMTIEDWSVVLKIAKRWHFSQVKMLALRYLERMEMSDVDRIVLYRKIDIDESVCVPSYAALCARQDPLTPEEKLQLGSETIFRLGSARDRVRRLLKGDGDSTSLPSTGELHSIIVDVFSLEVSLPDAQLDINLTKGRGNVEQVLVVDSPNPQHNRASLQRHKIYFLHDGNLFILIGIYLFRVHRFFFLRESSYFQDKLAVPAGPSGSPRGTSESNAIVLDDVSVAAFEKFLWVFYNPKYSLYDAAIEDWSTILDLASKWKFPEVKALAIRELEKFTMSDVDRIVLYHKHGIDKAVLVPRYAALCAREQALTFDEGLSLGMETALNIARARECTRSQFIASRGRLPSPSDFKTNDIHSLIADLFGIPQTPNGTDTADAGMPIVYCDVWSLPHVYLCYHNLNDANANAGSGKANKSGGQRNK